MAEDLMQRAYKASLGMEPIARYNYFVHIIANTWRLLSESLIL